MDFTIILLCFFTISFVAARPYFLHSSEEFSDEEDSPRYFNHFYSHRQPIGTHRHPFGTHRQPIGSHRHPFGTHRQPFVSQRQPLGNIYSVFSPFGRFNSLPVQNYRYRIHDTVPGAIPLLIPMNEFPSDYQSNDFVARPNSVQEPDYFSSFDDWNPSLVQTIKRPSFSAIGNTRVFRKPTYDVVKPESPQTYDVTDQEKEQAYDVTETETVVPSENQDEKENLVRYAHFPSEIGESFGLRDSGNDLTLSAPAGIVQSTQPRFSFTPFRNSKASDHLKVSPSEDVPRFVADDGVNFPVLIEA